MGPGDLTAPVGRLHDALTKLFAHWEEVKPLWQDNVREQFDKNYLERIKPQTMATLERINALAQMIQRAKQDCTERGDFL